MKKYLYLIALGCLGMIRPMNAADTDISALDNVIYVESFAAKPGSTELTMSFQMKNSAPIRGFQFDLELPVGVTLATYASGAYKCSLNSARLPEGDQHTLVPELTEGKYRFLCGSLQDENFTGSSGEIATVKINIAADMAVGSYPIALTAMKLSETDISKFYETERIEATLTISNTIRTVLDETSTTAPTASNGAVNVRVKRTINANEWSTICLPFAMTAEQIGAAFGSNVTVELADFTGYTVEGNCIKVGFSDVTAIEANHPYIIKVSAGISEFLADNVVIDPSSDPRVSYKSGKKLKDFVGTFVAEFDFYNEATNTPLFLSENKFWYATEKTKKMKAFRGYFDFNDELSDAASRITMVFNEDTGIRSVTSQTTCETYDLQGRRVVKPAGGLYIKGGKKVIMK